MRNLCLSIVALTAFAAPAAAQTIPACPAAAGVKDVSYAQAPDLVKQVFSKNRKFSMPGGAFDAKTDGAQRLIGVKNKGNRWVIAYEMGGDYVAKVARYDLPNANSISVGPERDAQPDNFCQVVNTQLGLISP